MIIMYLHTVNGQKILENKVQAKKLVKLIF